MLGRKYYLSSTSLIKISPPSVRLPSWSVLSWVWTRPSDTWYCCFNAKGNFTFSWSSANDNIMAWQCYSFSGWFVPLTRKVLWNLYWLDLQKAYPFSGSLWHNFSIFYYCLVHRNRMVLNFFSLFFLLLSLKCSKGSLCTMWFQTEKYINFEQAFCFGKYPFQDSCVFIGMNGTASKDRDKYFILSIENNLLSAEKLFELARALIWEVINFWHLLGSLFSAFTAKINGTVLSWEGGLGQGCTGSGYRSVPGPSLVQSHLRHPQQQPASQWGQCLLLVVTCKFLKSGIGAWHLIYELRHLGLEMLTWAFSIVGAHTREKQQPFVLNNLFLKGRSR